MYPFSTTRLNYNPENFFPRINQEYRGFVRKGFVLEEIRDQVKFSVQEYEEAWTREPFETEEPSFQIDDSDDVEPITSGQKFDVISVLSPHVDHLVRCVGHGTDDDYNNHCEFVNVGVEESLKGKRFVLLVSVFVPAKWCESNAEMLTSLSIVSSEVSSHSDFEMVLVPKMRRKPDVNGFYGADAFHHFFTAFPNRLAVPFSSKRACDIMCRKLGFTGELTTALIGPNHEVLSHASDIVCFGSAGYPFTLERHVPLQNELCQLSLARLLGCDPTTRLRKFGSSEDVSVDNLSTRLVGLYLFQRGDYFKAINEVYQKCVERDRSNGVEPQFEIVLVCMPPYGYIHPFVFEEEAHSVLQALGLCQSWWVFPYDNSACCRLLILSEDIPRDVLIIVDPRTGLMEPYGAQILSYVGMDAYPFTREAFVQFFVEKAKKITLQSLLSRRTVDYVIQPDGQRMSVSDLLGKYVFLYLDYQLKSEFATEMLREWYDAIKEHHSESDFKFVFVQFNASNDGCPTVETQSGNIPWLVYPCDAAHSDFLRNHELFFMAISMDKIVMGLRPPVLLAFGKDGYIRMLDGRRHVMRYLVEPEPEPEPERKKRENEEEAYPFVPSVEDLRSQVIQKMCNHVDFMRGYM